eukprot:438049-Lingulodinium_polyedra.AAC.1
MPVALEGLASLHGRGDVGPRGGQSSSRLVPEGPQNFETINKHKETGLCLKQIIKRHAMRMKCNQ